jgi:5-methylcytosine-specific restriction enzyme subunit McrC
LPEFRKHITVFEHEAIRYDKGEKRITEDQLSALQRYAGEAGVPYYSLIYNGVCFNEYVGVIQVGRTTIEILPKSDKKSAAEGEEARWRKVLIGMLKVVGSFEIKTTSESNLKLRTNTVLDLYFEMFIKEVEYLVHNGLVKKYRKSEGNVNSLKGSLQFGKNIHNNLIHQERFYVKFSEYDYVHKLHQIIYKTILLLLRINSNPFLNSRIGWLLLIFPEMTDIKITESTFDGIEYNRKTQCYKKAIDIARLLLLQYHPDLIKGRNHVLALMFDMNLLWERFLLITLKKYKSDNLIIRGQLAKSFWKPKNGKRTKVVPDIVISALTTDKCIVLDTKWKNLNSIGPSPDDLRQMFVYSEYFYAEKTALIYPSNENSMIGGFYLNPKDGAETRKECSIISIAVNYDIKKWQNKIIEFLKPFMMIIPYE